MEKQTALKVRKLSVSFRMYKKGTRQTDLRVIHNLNLTLFPGEILAVAGSSGSGKSLLAHAILGILPRNAAVGGEMTWFGDALTPKLQAKLRGNELALVPQSVTYLDPMMQASKQVAKNKETVRKLFSRYHLQDDTAQKYPHQLSGGMTRRILLSTAFVGNPKVIIADEPTPGLSEQLAEKAMEHFREIADSGTAVLLITHDLDLAVRYADRIAVFYSGTTVETSHTSDWANGESGLRHPYSKALWQAMPQNGFNPTLGTQPYAGALPEGCLFAPRCPLVTDKCRNAVPEFRESNGREVCCHYAS